jgi:uncharacterized protein (TIGR02452 family)
MASRETRARVAQETLDILERGQYRAPSGELISIRDELESARSRSVMYNPAESEQLCLCYDSGSRPTDDRSESTFTVVNAASLCAARDILALDAQCRVLVLNFASARNPGGGFLKGSQAQEESLARASALYACLERFPEMYEANRRFRSCLYTDHMIYAPDVPVFRDDNDTLLDEPCRVSFLTAPAVNAGAVRMNEPANVPRIEPVMRSRMEKLLTIAAAHDHPVLVLGAWGCGVFANNPDQVAAWFAHFLRGEWRFRRVFRQVIFAVLDWTPQGSTIGPFERHFSRDPREFRAVP